ncbi:hypothetical protein Ddye_028141 [Dipteronia dyeriana]|uniref:Reverse transcriptase domain-containing protein n=1 Tax=Dipteronia dyeriana TaxID=168575 RepID=A0AAD9TQL9_9ROSI|nr:hypothetical protein Ddye_028141 [Dipteronia dyeriana]
MNFIKGFHEDRAIVKDINNTFIALIPKRGTSESLSVYRSISLVNYMYKILAKVLVNRLKTVMRDIINECQSTFVRNRQIIDSFMVAEEIIQSWKRDKEDGLIIKLDFKKAYDNVDHAILDSMIEGGLDIGSMGDKNKSLLVKWIWRFGSEGKSLRRWKVHGTLFLQLLGGQLHG